MCGAENKPEDFSQYMEGKWRNIIDTKDKKAKEFTLKLELCKASPHYACLYCKKGYESEILFYSIE
jgi:hypothetical protein